MLQNTNEQKIDLREHSPLALAFIGDGVIELLVRTRLVETKRMKPGQLHRQAIEMVSAKGQFIALQEMDPHLTEAEKDIVRRGRNASKASVSKNASQAEYRASTGMEALFGWLYLQNMQNRIDELFEYIWESYCKRKAQQKNK